MPRPKTGGRVAGTPNKANSKARAFFQGIFEEAFADVGFRTDIVAHIKDFSLEPQLLRAFLAYAYGSPTRQVDHQHSGHVTLAQLVAGTAPDDDDLDDEELDV